MLLSCCSCNKTAVPSPEGKPELNGSFAYLAGNPESGLTDIYISNSEKEKNVSSTWKMNNASYISFSPDGKQLLFEARDGLHWRLYIYDVESGSIPNCLTSSIDEDCRHPRFSPDGKNVVFSKAGQIVLLDLASSKLSALTFDSSADNDYPVFSSDGSSLAYVSLNKLHLLDLASLSSSSIKLRQESKLSLPVYVGESLLYLDGQNIMLDGNKLFESDAFFSYAFGNWILFSKGNQAYIANFKTKEKYEILQDVKAQIAYTDKSLNIADPEDGGRVQGSSDNIVSDTELPPLKGKMVYHNYTSYDSMDSRMYIYDFAMDELTEISRNWTVVSHPMNGHFSPDGKYITFMGIGSASDSWDIFLYELGSTAQPINLTPEGSYRDEDPKFSYSGEKICFKRNDHLCEITLSDKKLKVLSPTNEDPYSMPYYTVDDSKILFAGGHDPNSYIALWDIASSSVTKLYDKAGTVEYYPITIDENSFYYSRHVSSTNTHDQLIKGYFDASAPKQLAFNTSNADYSDACPVSEGWLILVSTRSDSLGGYDMYIAHESSGAIYSLSKYNKALNTSKNELGPDYISL